MLTNFGKTAGMSWVTGDFNGDNRVDVNDLTIVLSNFNQSAGASAAGLSAVPEPTGLILLGIGAIGLLAVAWRREIGAV